MSVFFSFSPSTRPNAQEYRIYIYQNTSTDFPCSAAALKTPKFIATVSIKDKWTGHMFCGCSPPTKRSSPSLDVSVHQNTSIYIQNKTLQKCLSSMRMSRETSHGLPEWAGWRFETYGSNTAATRPCFCVCFFSWEDQKLTMQEVWIGWLKWASCRSMSLFLFFFFFSERIKTKRCKEYVWSKSGRGSPMTRFGGWVVWNRR